MPGVTHPPGGTFRLGDDVEVTRFGYGAMQLAGKRVFGSPRDRDAALTVLRSAVDAGITHIDTADFYGPAVVNELIREALAPYPTGLHLVTKVGVLRDDRGRWPVALSADELRRAVEQNLEHLGLDVLDVVNLRVGDQSGAQPGSIGGPFTDLLALQQEGLIRHLGVSNVTADQVAEARALGPVVCVQNAYNLTNRADDPLIEDLAETGVAYVPYFPLGGFGPLQSSVLERVAARLGASARSVALAWLLQRSPNVLVIAGTSSADHLRENIAGAGTTLPDDALLDLEGIAG